MEPSRKPAKAPRSPQTPWRPQDLSAEAATHPQAMHVRPFEKEFSRYVEATRKKYRPQVRELGSLLCRKELATGQRQNVKAQLRELATDLRELDVVDFFLRRTEGERPDAEKLANRVHELRQRGHLTRGGWVLKRFGSLMGAHWCTVPQQ